MLEKLLIDSPDRVWASDRTEISGKQEFVYLLAILAHTRRYVIAWLVSIILDVEFCLHKGIRLN